MSRLWTVAVTGVVVATVLVGTGVGEVSTPAAHHTVQQRPGPGKAPTRLSDEALASALRAKLDADAAQDRFSGAVLVARGDHVVFAGAAGLADRNARTPNTVATLFRMGSMNKMFTATAILQLVQAGKVKLNATVGTYLRDYPNRDVAERVTIDQLLTHTGGTGNIFGPLFEARRLELRSLDDYVRLYGTRGLDFPPGSKWDYSNYGFVLLGVVIECVSGQNYYDYVRDHVFAPAGMTATASEPESRLVPGRAKGYMREGTMWISNADTLPWRGTSAGGGYTSVEDLLRFARALTHHVLLDARHTMLLVTGQVNTGRGGKYARGFFDEGVGPDRYVGHSGGAPGMNGELRIYPQSGCVVAALANMDFGASEAVRWVAERWR